MTLVRFSHGRSWIALAGAAFLTLSIFVYASYALIPIKFILPFQVTYAIATFLWRWLSTIVIVVPRSGVDTSSIWAWWWQIRWVECRSGV
jgi:hypothetical protein